MASIDTADQNALVSFSKTVLALGLSFYSPELFGGGWKAPAFYFLGQECCFFSHLFLFSLKCVASASASFPSLPLTTGF